MSSSEQNLEPNPPSIRRKRLKIANACQSCRTKKAKCDGVRPACGNCQRKPSLRESCTYSRDTARPGLPLVLPVQESEASQTRQPLPRSSSVGVSEEPGAEDSTNAQCDGAHGIFTGEVNSAIDAKLGLRSGGILSLIPMANAPLLGPLRRNKAPDRESYHSDHVLPPRKHADNLVDLYWRYLQPLEPLLDQESFTQSYEALFAGTRLGMDEKVFLAMLNIVFALSTQLQDWTPFAERDDASSTYFNRAWSLLSPEAILWEPGSVEVVQCLLLMGRYLLSTDNPHQAWMSVNSAVAVAQNLGLHKFQASSADSPTAQRRRHAWKCCIFIHRVTSWALGRTTAGTPVIAAEFMDDTRSVEESRKLTDIYFSKCLEIYEVASHIMLFHTPSGCGLSDKLGLPRLYRSEEFYSTAVKLDGYSDKWYKSLPRSLTFEALQGNVNEGVYPQALMLHLRYLHCKIFLFRPMLAHLCLSQSRQLETTSLATHGGLGDNFLRDCALLCVESAQKMIDAVHAIQQPDGTIGALPWWHRFFYLYSAATILIAAMLRAELFTPSISQCWSRAIQALRAHEHLSPFAHQCVTAFHSLSSKILETHPGGSQFPPSEGVSNTYFQDCFQEIGLEPDNFLFGIEDMSWLNHFTEP